MTAFLIFLGLKDKVANVSPQRIKHAAMSKQDREDLRLWTSNASQFR